jgi:hypothetical protein
VEKTEEIFLESEESSEETDGAAQADKFDLRPVVQAKERALVPYDPLQMYLLEIKNYTLLTREEERELAIRVREKKDQKLQTRYLKLETGGQNRHGFSSILDEKSYGPHSGRQRWSVTSSEKIRPIPRHKIFLLCLFLDQGIHVKIYHGKLEVGQNWYHPNSAQVILQPGQGKR